MATLPSEFFLQDEDSDCSDTDFDGYIEESEGRENVPDVGDTISGEVAAKEMEAIELESVETQGVEQSKNVIPLFKEQTGVTSDMKNLRPIDFFFKLFPHHLIAYIVTESNRYGQQYLESHAAYLQQHPKARANQLRGKPIEEDEVKKFIALVIGMGIVNIPDMQQYWSQNWPFSSSNFSSIMSRDRFLLLLKFLHLADNSKMAAKGEKGYDSLFKVRHLLSTLIPCYKESYTLKKEISVDESIISYKGRLSFLQFMPNKPHKWGIKAWVLAEAETGYTWNFHLYTGKEETRPADLPLGTHVVMDLVKDLSGKGHHVYFDNFYTSPQLCKALFTEGFGCCGTVRLDRKEIPETFKEQVVCTGEVVYYRDGEILGLKWKDKRIVALLTTIHDKSIVETTRVMKGGLQQKIEKPQSVHEYNKYMGGVDKAGQLVQYYGFNNFSKKWWKRVFFHMLDVTLVNAYILYKSCNTGKSLSHLKFRIAVAKDLCTTAEDTPTRLLGRNHFPEKSGGKHDCCECSDRTAGKRKTTIYQCSSCQVYLCIDPCFKTYHTVN